MNPTTYEDTLGDALEALLKEDCNELATLAAGLVRLQVPTPTGQTAWTEAVLASELRRLGE